MIQARPNDERGFIHKKLLRTISKVTSVLPIPGLGAISRITGALGGSGATRVPSRFTAAFPGGAPRGFCPPGTAGCGPQRVVNVPGFRGRAERFFPGGSTGLMLQPTASRAQADFGAAVVGQFGAGLEPAVRSGQTRICPRGAVLATDGLCYNKRDISNKNREWPRGRRPLLTGGEMHAISIASSAARKLERKEKQLRSMGMMKQIRKGGRRALPSGHHAHVAHN